MDISELLSDFAAKKNLVKNFEIINMAEFSGTEAQIYSVMQEGESSTLLSQFFEENAQYKKELITLAEKTEC
ncbi:MAG: hypothetical protein IJT97_03430 [Bacteroidaceae bacterium]|nr:hypothetical protein [Bacteroidaceae bacterium]